MFLERASILGFQNVPSSFAPRRRSTSCLSLKLSCVLDGSFGLHVRLGRDFKARAGTSQPWGVRKLLSNEAESGIAIGGYEFARKCWKEKGSAVQSSEL